MNCHHCRRVVYIEGEPPPSLVELVAEMGLCGEPYTVASPRRVLRSWSRSDHGHLVHRGHICDTPSP